jgi:hypothetical protein
MFKLGRTWGMVPETAENPATGVEKFPETPRRVCATPGHRPNQHLTRVRPWTCGSYGCCGKRRGPARLRPDGRAHENSRVQLCCGHSEFCGNQPRFSTPGLDLTEVSRYSL